MITVAIVDDYEVVRVGLAELLGTSAEIAIVGTASNGRDAVELVDSLRPDVVMMDLSMPAGGGVDAIRRIKRRHASCKVLVLTAFAEHGRIKEAFGAGADGYLLKHSHPDDLLDAIRCVAHGGRLAPLLEHDEAAPLPVDRLTSRQLDVLALLRAGTPNRDIADELGIGERTLKADLAQIYRHLGVTSRTQAAIWAMHHAPLA